MANPEYIAQLMKGVASWNAWRAEEPTCFPDLSDADLRKANLSEANLYKANLSEADLFGARNSPPVPTLM